jgi:hypothetical protein
VIYRTTSVLEAIGIRTSEKFRNFQPFLYIYFFSFLWIIYSIRCPSNVDCSRSEDQNVETKVVAGNRFLISKFTPFGFHFSSRPKTRLIFTPARALLLLRFTLGLFLYFLKRVNSRRWIFLIPLYARVCNPDPFIYEYASSFSLTFLSDDL